MSHALQITDEQFETLVRAAQRQGQTPDALLNEWIATLDESNDEPGYYETDDWFRHLGATEEQIAEAKRIARERGSANT